MHLCHQNPLLSEHWNPGRRHWSPTHQPRTINSSIFSWMHDLSWWVSCVPGSSERLLKLLPEFRTYLDDTLEWCLWRFWWTHFLYLFMAYTISFWLFQSRLFVPITVVKVVKLAVAPLVVLLHWSRLWYPLQWQKHAKTRVSKARKSHQPIQWYSYHAVQALNDAARSRKDLQACVRNPRDDRSLIYTKLGMISCPA